MRITSSFERLSLFAASIMGCSVIHRPEPDKYSSGRQWSELLCGKDTTFINENHWFRGNDTFCGVEIRSSRRSRRSFRKMIGKPFYGIRLMYRFMKLAGNISEQAASGCQNAINHICCELPMRFWKCAGDFISKSQNFSFQTVGDWCRVSHKESPFFLFSKVFVWRLNCTSKMNMIPYILAILKAEDNKT